MGGGSADAAAVLRGLNEIYGSLSIAELECIAAELGSDVPFCVRGGTQIAKGRGEKLSPCSEMPECYIVVACGGEGLSTSLAYRMLDEKFDDFNLEKEADRLCGFEKNMCDLNEMCLELYNIFESVTAEVCPEMPKLKNKFITLGALGTLMCGSGPAVFGIFDSEDLAKYAVDVIKKDGCFAELCTPIKKLI
jgi:4-diphosphocytidyl-2-C-methyl-D-erythritol kinase